MFHRSHSSSQAEMTDTECAAQETMRKTNFHQEAVRRFLAKEPRLYDWDEIIKSG